MATRKQSKPAPALGNLFAGPDDRTPAQLVKLDNTRAIPGLWSYADRQAYVDSKPGTAMYDLNGSHNVAIYKKLLADIDAKEAAKRQAKQQAEENWRKRY